MKRLISVIFVILSVNADPKAKEAIRGMLDAICDHLAWDDWEVWNDIMLQYFREDMVYDTNYYDGTNEFMGNGTGIRSWWDREHIPINLAFDNETFHELIWAGDDTYATNLHYAMSPWTKGPFFGIEPINEVIVFRCFDFYIFDGEKIAYNWMLLDAPHILHQAGYEVLPNNLTPLKQGWIRAPNAMDGTPAPWSRAVNPKQTEIARAISMEALYHDLTIGPKASPFWKSDMVWYGAYGFGMAENYDDYSLFFVEALAKAFTDREFHLDVMTCEGNFCGALGHLVGNFTGHFLGESPSNTMTSMRIGLHWHVDTIKNEIIEGYGMADLQGFFIQSGVDLYKRAILNKK